MLIAIYFLKITSLKVTYYIETAKKFHVQPLFYVFHFQMTYFCYTVHHIITVIVHYTHVYHVTVSSAQCTLVWRLWSVIDTNFKSKMHVQNEYK